MSTGWITHRRPTKADEDKDGEVFMQRFPDGRASSADKKTDALVSSAHVGPGVPWMHTLIWEPPAKPAPVAPAVSRDLPGFFGETITSVLPTKKYANSTYKEVISTAAAKRLQYSSPCFVYYDKILPGEPWLPEPRLDSRPMRDNDPTKPPLPVPVPTATKDAERRAVLSGAAFFYVVVAHDDEYLLAWETDVYAGGTLRKCLKQQATLLSKYSKVCIAQCKIIPELTQP